MASAIKDKFMGTEGSVAIGMGLFQLFMLPVAFLVVLRIAIKLILK